MNQFNNLFILAFDHRSSFAKKMFGVRGEPTPEQTKQISDFKWVIYKGFKQALASGEIDTQSAAILADEQYADAVLQDAKTQGITFCLAVEKSGQDEFDFEYGDAFSEHIERYKPTIVKALIRYNPESDKELNKRQREKLRVLSDYCNDHGYTFLIEPLIPATPEQLDKVGDDQVRYDNEMRPALMVKMIDEMQQDSVEPSIWKIEGLERSEDYTAVVKQARSGGRDHVSAVVLGRGANAEQVAIWLNAGKSVDGVIGFAIGRTIFWEPLMGIKNGTMSKDEAVKQIAENFKYFYTIFSRP